MSLSSAETKRPKKLKNSYYYIYNFKLTRWTIKVVLWYAVVMLIITDKQV